MRGGERDEPRRFTKARPDPRLSSEAAEQYKRERQRVAELVDKGKISNVEAKTRLNQIRRRFLPDEAPVRVLRPMGSSAQGVRERLSRTAHGRDARDSLRQQQAQQASEKRK